MSSRKVISVEFIIYAVLALVLGTFIILAIPMLFKSSTDVQLGNTTFHTRLAANETERANGLAGVENLSYDDGLLMAFPKNGKWPVMMNDMKIHIDIVWLNERKQVVYMIKNAPPQSATSYKLFRPTKEARYVLQLPSGSINAYSITLNSFALFAVDETEVE